jgi:hypothetical protein
MTLLELTVVILVLLSLIMIINIGAHAWKRGSDRALCIMYIHNVQKGVRSYANFYGLSEGAVTPNLQSKVIGAGRFMEVTPTCPAHGVYSFGQSAGTNTIPPMGELYMQCSLSASFLHVPQDHSDW